MPAVVHSSPSFTLYSLKISGEKEYTNVIKTAYLGNIPLPSIYLSIYPIHPSSIYLSIHPSSFYQLSIISSSSSIYLLSSIHPSSLYQLSIISSSVYLLSSIYPSIHNQFINPPIIPLSCIYYIIISLCLPSIIYHPLYHHLYIIICHLPLPPLSLSPLYF